MTPSTGGQGSVDYPYAPRDVHDALVAAVEGMRTMRLVSDDESSGLVVVKPVGGLLSWSRNILFSVVATAAGTSKVSAEAPPRANALLGGAFDTGQYLRNVDAVINATSSELSRRSPAHMSPHGADSGRIAELQSFLDRDFISQEEFDRWTAGIRDGQ